MTQKDAPPPQNRFKAGEQITDRYQVTRLLGSGSFAEVYHCRDNKLRRDVAVKVLKQQGEGLEEAQAAAALHHQHIVEVYDVSNLDDGTPVIVFHYVAGKTLAERLAETEGGKLPLNADALRIIQQISEALDYAHGQGVIHRDIKPSNIMVDDQGSAYLTDFGLANIKWPAIKERTQSMLTADDTGSLGGTISFMAPEQLAEAKLGDERSDQYSWGVVVYKMLTGQLPYPKQETGGETVLIAQIIARDPIPPTLVNPRLGIIEPILLQVLNKRPEDRYASCMGFATELSGKARAYAEMRDRYERAQSLFQAGKWRQAIAAFEPLRQDWASFEAADEDMRQARDEIHQLDLYDAAQKALSGARYQDALDALGQLREMGPSGDLAELSQQARDGLYRQAVEYFRSGNHIACVNAICAIREHGLEFVDSEGIEAQAQEEIKEQRDLEELYRLGREQMEHGQWQEALATFQKLKDTKPNYRDVDTRFASAHHIALLDSLMSDARAFLREGRFVECLDKLEVLRDKDEAKTFRTEEAALLRQEALNRMREKIELLSREERFEESLAALGDLQKRSPASEQPILEELVSQVREGRRVRDLRARLDALYRQALDHLNRHNYREALGAWQAIQQQKGNLDYGDSRDVELRAKDGLCLSLYNQASLALAQKDRERAAELWRQIREINANYPDDQQLDKRIHAARKSQAALGFSLAALIRQVRQRASESKRRPGALRSEAQPPAERVKAERLYSQAMAALTQKRPRRALELWRQIQQVDPRYSDALQVEQGAQEMLREMDNQAKAHWAKARRWSPIVGGVLGLAILAFLAIAMRPRIFAAASLPAPTTSLDAGSLAVAAAAPAVEPTAPPSPAPTAEPTASPSPAPTDTPSPSPSPAPTAAPTASPSPAPSTPTPAGNLATARLSSSIYAAPDGSSQERGVVRADEQVTVTGRAAPGFESWLYVRNNKGIEGFVYAPRFILSGNVDALAVVKPSVAIPTRPAGCVPSTEVVGLTMDLYPFEGGATCIGDDWYQPVYIAGHGGNGCYTFYWNREKLDCPASWECVFKVKGRGGPTTSGAGKVVSGDGQQVELAISIAAPTGCRWEGLPPTPDR